MGKRNSESVSQAIVIAVLEGGMSTRDAAQRFGISQRWVRALVRKARLEGIEAIKPGSRRPKTNPNQTSQEVRQRIFFIRDELKRSGLDAGPESIWDRLDEPRPHPTTIYRILRAAGKVEPEPRKRPKRSYIRFQASLPNQMWQSDFTHVSLANGTQVEVITWLDDHSRYALHISAYKRVTGHIVVDTFTQAAHQHGYPTSTLTDNGMVYTARFAAGARGEGNQKNMFEKLLADLGIQQKNGHPGHPTTQGKVERFQATLKQWIKAQPPPQTLDDLNKQLGEFQTIYNQKRPHRSLNRQTPHQVYNALSKAEPTIKEGNQTWRTRHDKVGSTGTLTYRYTGKLKHLGIGRQHAFKPVIILANGPHTMIIERTTGEIIAEHNINPNKNYQPKTRGQ